MYHKGRFIYLFLIYTLVYVRGSDQFQGLFEQTLTFETTVLYIAATVNCSCYAAATEVLK